MECYDARIIEGCCVYSYTVEGPSRPVSQKAMQVKAPKKIVHKKKVSRVNPWKRAILGVLFLLLVPFAFAIDMACLAVKKAALAVCAATAVRPVRRTACALTCVSLICAVTLIL